MATPSRTPLLAIPEQLLWYVRYGAAVALSGAALGVTMLLAPLRPSAETPAFLLAVAGAAWFGGAGPALLATVLSAVSLDVYVFPPRLGWSFRRADLIGLAWFLGASIVIASIARRRSRAETRLGRSEERYGAFIQNSSEGIWCFEGEQPLPTDISEDEQIERFYRYAYLSECNEALARMYGFNSAAELRGARVGDFLVRSDPRNVEYLRAFIRSGYRLSEAESFERDRDGNTHYFLNNLVGVVENGKLLRAWGTQRDITERRRAEEALQGSEKLASVGRLAATIAHEINNPLEAIGGILHLLLRDANTTPRAKELLSTAREELRRIGQITKNTLTFYREAPSAVGVNVSEVLDSVLALYERNIRFDDIRVVRHYDFRGEIQGFPGELRQVFSNLVRNALEAVRQGGVVTVRVAQGCDWRNPEKRGIRVSVADDGVGVPAENRAKLFQPFFTTKGEKGTGIGLWITRGIVGKHGGDIRMRSSTREGHSGTCFSVFLPGVTVAVPSPASQAS
ncbi:MAG TPA: ATP-binding protein [Terriglobales bacterium]|nr:ATP-binding protein [Terriglobales bacterium]